MNSKDDILDTWRLCFEGDFDTQLEHLLDRVRLTADEVQGLRRLFKDLERALRDIAPGLQVMPFGSIVTGLGIKTSDVDCYVALKDGPPSNTYVIAARNMLRKYHQKFTNLFAIVNANVPIVKFLHIPTNCNCDVNFKSASGVQNSELIATLLHMDPQKRALPLAILIKYWSKVHRITGTNLLTSYALTLMVIFYLQLTNILPSVAEMQKDVPPYVVEDWNTAFDKDFIMNTANNDSLYDLLGGFFKYYANLNYDDNIISPFMGRLIQKESVKNMDDVPKESELYVHNLLANVCKPLNVDAPICVQDVFQLSKNVTGGVHLKLANRIKAFFEFAAKKFDEVPPNEFLKVILTEKPMIETETPNTKKELNNKHVFAHNKVFKPSPIKKKSGGNKFVMCYQQINKMKKINNGRAKLK